MNQRICFSILTTYQDRKTNSMVLFLEKVLAGKFVFDFYWPLVNWLRKCKDKSQNANWEYRNSRDVKGLLICSLSRWLPLSLPILLRFLKVSEAWRPSLCSYKIHKEVTAFIKLQLIILQYKFKKDLNLEVHFSHFLDLLLT